MSLASDYAAAIAAENVVMSGVEATVPDPYIGPGGLMVCNVKRDGTAEVIFGNTSYPVPGAVLLSFAAWVNTTFG